MTVYYVEYTTIITHLRILKLTASHTDDSNTHILGYFSDLLASECWRFTLDNTTWGLILGTCKCCKFVEKYCSGLQWKEIVTQNKWWLQLLKFQRHDNWLKVDSTVHASPIPPHLYQENCSFNSKTVSCHTFHFPRTDNTDTVKPGLKSTGNAFNIFHSTQHSIQRSEDLFQAVHTLQTVLWLTPVYIVHGLFGQLRDKKTVGSMISA